MSGLLRLSDAFSLAIHAMAYMGHCQDDQPVSAERMAQAFDVSEAHLAKVLQNLARRGLLASRRGVKGGFVLARRPEKFTLLEIHEAVDGPLPCGQCMLDHPMCPAGGCVMSALMKRVHRETQRHLAATRLSVLVKSLGEAKKPKRPARKAGRTTEQ